MRMISLGFQPPCATVMAKKRGRPPKTPITEVKSVSDTLVDVAVSDKNPIGFDTKLDDEDLEIINNLSAKKLESLMHGLDLTRERVKGKKPVDHRSEGLEDHVRLSERSVENEAGPSMKRDRNEQHHTDQVQKTQNEKRSSVWDSFDISKLRNAGEKLNFI
ncbi:hypothetical protein RIF29_34473 [Crotalaria pallida]|uniref:Uncharacterized protein n=1 Tax=Crotalaria pallida TaxID=3830 RepID=A0AAN9E8Y7_CROPI